MAANEETVDGGSLQETLAGLVPVDGERPDMSQRQAGDDEQAPPAAATRTTQPVSPGAAVGRYIVLEKLGQGAMGVVWSAWDPELDRRVALKLLKTKHGRSGEEDRIRLQREAQALARLSHPNVVAVFDVGVHQAHLFVAMEHVDGKTLSRWAQEDAPSAGQRTSALLAAGEGLAAAHASGLVHRDFKPDNVMIDASFRVRVMDFGLARQRDEVGESNASGASVARIESSLQGRTVDGGSASSDSFSPSQPRFGATSPSLRRGTGSQTAILTVQGSLVGTPAYMAPEQFEGKPADAKSDQFSFCVTAWEVLVGKRPFVGESIAAIAFAATQGELQPPPAGSMLAPTQRRALERGLQAEPAKRWPSMPELLRALEDKPPQSKRVWPIVALVAVAAGGAAVGYSQVENSRARAVCSSVEEQLKGSWDSAKRANLRSGLLSSGSPLAEEMALRVEARVDQWASAWVATSAPTCLGQVKLAEDLARSQIRCLAQGRADLDALVSVLEKADDEAVRRALEGVERLPDPKRCADPLFLSAAVKPAEAAVAEEVARLDTVIRVATAERRAGASAAAEARLNAVLEEIEATAYLPLRYAAHLERARLLEARSQHRPAFDDALLAARLAIQAGDSETAALATLLAGASVRSNRESDATVDLLMEFATSFAIEAGNSVEVRRERLHTRAAIDYTRALHAEAAAGFLEELALLEEIPDSASLQAGAYLALSAAERGLGTLEVADEHAAKAQALYEQVYPSSHPLVASALDRRGAFAYERGDIVAARGYFEKALELYIAGLGPNHPETSNARNNVAGMLSIMGESDAAEAMYKEALAARRLTLAPDDAMLGTSICNLAMVVSNRGAHDEGIALYEEGLPIIEKAKGPDHPDVAWIAVNFATTLRASGRLEDAAAWGQRAVEIRENKLGAEHPHLAMALHGLADTRLAAGDANAAKDLAARALSIWEKAHGPESGQVTQGLATLAAAEVGLGNHRVARDLAQRALRILDREPVKSQEKIAQLHAVIATAALADRDPVGALESYEKSLAAAGDQGSLQRGEAYAGKARMLWALRRREEALASMAAALLDFEADGLRSTIATQEAKLWLADHKAGE